MLTKQSALDALTKSNLVAITRAFSTGDNSYIGRTISILHRGASAKQQKVLDAVIEHCHDWREFTLSNGVLLHNSEI